MWQVIVAAAMAWPAPVEVLSPASVRDGGLSREEFAAGFTRAVGEDPRDRLDMAAVLKGSVLYADFLRDRIEKGESRERRLAISYLDLVQGGLVDGALLTPQERRASLTAACGALVTADLLVRDAAIAYLGNALASDFGDVCDRAQVEPVLAARLGLNADSAIRAIANLGFSELRPRIEELAAASGPGTSSEAARRALAQLGDPHWREEYNSRFVHADPVKRWQAVRMASQLNLEDVVPLLVDALADEGTGECPPYCPLESVAEAAAEVLPLVARRLGIGPPEVTGLSRAELQDTWRAWANRHDFPVAPPALTTAPQTQAP